MGFAMLANNGTKEAKILAINCENSGKKLSDGTDGQELIHFILDFVNLLLIKEVIF